MDYRSEIIFGDQVPAVVAFRQKYFPIKDENEKEQYTNALALTAKENLLYVMYPGNSRSVILGYIAGYAPRFFYAIEHLPLAAAVPAIFPDSLFKKYYFGLKTGCCRESLLVETAVRHTCIDRQYVFSHLFRHFSLRACYCGFESAICAMSFRYTIDDTFSFLGNKQINGGKNFFYQTVFR